MKSNTYCIIMAGGIGTRFWPISRKSMPKQFLDILGTGKSFIRATYERFAALVPDENFLVVTNRAYKELVMQHIPELKDHRVWQADLSGQRPVPFRRLRRFCRYVARGTQAECQLQSGFYWNWTRADAPGKFQRGHGLFQDGL